MKNKKIKKIIFLKGKRQIVSLTSYTFPISKILNRYCDFILVGDSVGTVYYGMKSTREVTLDMMIAHSKSVKLGAKKNLVLVDMPYKTYQNKFDAYANANKIIKKTQCDGVKLEGGKKISKIVSYLVKKNIPVMGHIGYLPQKGDFFIAGKNKKEKKKLLNDARSLEKAGAFSIVLECITPQVAKEITKTIKIPTIGIGSSKNCDGQILVIDDMIGLSGFYPRFVKKYSNIQKIIQSSVKKYCSDVKNGRFPSARNSYK